MNCNPIGIGIEDAEKIPAKCLDVTQEFGERGGGREGERERGSYRDEILKKSYVFPPFQRGHVHTA
jgi:hypothetical protein